MKQISLDLPEEMIEQLDQLAEQKYATRAAAIRTAIRDLLRKEREVRG